jgi:hypothetical protein
MRLQTMRVCKLLMFVISGHLKCGKGDLPSSRLFAEFDGLPGGMLISSVCALCPNSVLLDVVKL